MLIIYNISFRNPSISFSRILGMFFIVLCHIIKYYSFIPMSESLGQFFNCGVYIFLFISGYLYGGKLIQNFRKWYLKRFLVVSLPAIIISLFFIILLLFFGENISVSSIVAYGLDLEGLLFFNWKLSAIFSEIPGLGHLWFTTIIMLCYLLIPLLQWISKRIKPSMWFLILYFLCGSVISILVSGVISVYYFLIFSVGYFAGKSNILNKVAFRSFLIFSIVFVSMIVSRLILHKYFDETILYTSFVTISHFFVALWFIVSFSFINNKFQDFSAKVVNHRIITTLDKYSYYVYLTHGLFCMGRLNVFSFFHFSIATLIFIISTIISAIVLKTICNTIGSANK